MSPKRIARIAGALNVASAIPAGFAVYALLKVLVRDDPGRTAANILARETFFRAGFVVDFISVALFLASMVFLYELFKPVSRPISLLLLCFTIVGSVIQVADSVGIMAALLLLKGGTSGALAVAQVHSQAYMFLRLHSLMYALALMFYGFGSLLICYLIWRSTFLPRILAPLMTIDGLGYIVFAATLFIFPGFGTRIYPVLPFATTLGELALFLWLIVKGVNVERWNTLAAR